MTCPYCGIGNHPVAECPERLEEQYGTPGDEDSHASRIAAQLAIAEDEDMEGSHE